MSNCDPIFPSFSSENEDLGVTEVESLCMKCYQTGVTKLLLTRIPHYKDVIITSFECQSCGERNNGIQSASLQEFGVKYELEVKSVEDLSRQIVRSEFASLSIPCIELNIPSSKGDITTIEGVVSKAIEELELDQPARKVTNIELYNQIENFLPNLKKLLEVKTPFIFKLDDPSGNSFVENPHAPKSDPQLRFVSYTRTTEQNEALGLQGTEVDGNTAASATAVGPVSSYNSGKLNLKEEVLQFNTICDHCSRPSDTKMKVTEIPHFKEVVIMASECESCGHRSNEVKSCAGIEEKGLKYSLRIKNREDLSRDVLKSETCSLMIPELDLSIGAGVFVGKFTTVEGLLCDVQKDLEKNPFLLGDTASQATKERIQSIIQDIQQVIDCKKSVCLIMDDPAGNSYVQQVDDTDSGLLRELYERTFDQNEELGLNDMVTENYAVE